MAYENQEELLNAIKSANENTSALAQLAQGQMMQAMRPQKSVVTTSTSNTNTTRPLEYADMANRRALIGLGRNEYEKALQTRERPIYTTLAGLASMPQQQGYGSFWGNAVRAFGSAGLAPYEARIDRLKQTYDLSNQEQEKAFQMGQAMGNQATQGQTSTQKTDYEQLPYELPVSGKASAKGSGDTKVWDNRIYGVSVNYDPVKTLREGDYTYMNQLGSTGGIGGWVASGIGGKEKAADLATIKNDLRDNTIINRILEFVEKAGSIKVADTEQEKRDLFGQLMEIDKVPDNQLADVIDRERNKFVTKTQKILVDSGVQGVTQDDLKRLFNSAFTVPNRLQTKDMHNFQDAPRFQEERASAGEPDWNMFK